MSDLFEQTWDFQTSRADAHYELVEIPFLYRKHTLQTALTTLPLYYSPVAIHFPGIAYRPTLREQWFNPCQQFLKWRYNEIGQTIFNSGRIPHLAYGFISKANRREDVLITNANTRFNGKHGSSTALISMMDEEKEEEQPEDRSSQGVWPDVSLTVFDINEVSNRDHQERWISAFYNGVESDVVSKWILMKQVAEHEHAHEHTTKPDVTHVPEVAKESSTHITGSFSATEKKLNRKRLSRVSELFLKKMGNTSTDRRRLQIQHTGGQQDAGDTHDDPVEVKEAEQSALIGSLFEQQTTSVQPERIILIETLDVGCFVQGNGATEHSNLPIETHRHVINDLIQYLSENLLAIYGNNLYWKPDKIVLRIKLSPCMARFFEQSYPPDIVEDQVLSGIKHKVHGTDIVHVVCSVHSNLDPKFFSILKFESPDAVFVLLEKELNFNIAALRGHVEDSIRAPLEMQSTLPVSLPLPRLYLDALLKTFLRTPVYAYGFSGLFVEFQERSVTTSAAAKTRTRTRTRTGTGIGANTDPLLRSTNHLVRKSPIPVDILNLRGGLVFRRGMLYILREDVEFLDHASTASDCQCTSESLLVSSILSRNKVSRVHIPYEGVFNVNRQRHAASRGNVLLPEERDEQAAALSRCLRCLLPTLQEDWLDPTNMNTQSTSGPGTGMRTGLSNEHRHTGTFTKALELDRNHVNRAKLSTCDTPSFQNLPQIDNLPGFSFQYNWDPASATSPCTQHLMTRHEESADAAPGLLGVGQFMTENHTMFSPWTSPPSAFWPRRPAFMIKLETGARLCSYAVWWQKQGNSSHMHSRILSCLLPPVELDPLLSTRHYAAITEGELCFYKGNSPHFGGSKEDSSHRELSWCTSPAEMNMQIFQQETKGRFNDKHKRSSAGKNRNKGSSAASSGHGSSNKPLELYSPPDLRETKLRNAIGRELTSHHSRKLRRSKRDVGELVKNSFKRRSYDVIKQRVQGKCILKVISPDLFPKTYLHVNMKGVFGLFVSTDYFPYDIVPPADRIASLKLKRCFKVFDPKEPG